MNVYLIFLALILDIDLNPTTVDTFDMIEVNHRYNEWGTCNLDQVIAWDWHKRDRDFHVEWCRS